METRRQSGDFQKNLNTMLLTIIIGLVSWLLVEVNHLDSQMAAKQVSDADAQTAIKGINDVMSDHSKMLQDHNNRLLELEFFKKK